MELSVFGRFCLEDLSVRLLSETLGREGSRGKKRWLVLGLGARWVDFGHVGTIVIKRLTFLLLSSLLHFLCNVTPVRRLFVALVGGKRRWVYDGGKWECDSVL